MVSHPGAQIIFCGGHGAYLPQDSMNPSQHSGYDPLPATKVFQLTKGSWGNAILLATTLQMGEPKTASEGLSSVLLSCESVG